MNDGIAELDGRPVSAREWQTLALTNYGHFTTFRADGGRVRGLALHLARLDRDCRAVFGVPLDPDRVRDLVRRAVPANDVTTVRVTVFDPGADLGHPAGARQPKILVTTRSAVTSPLPPLTVRSTVYARDSPEIKSVGLFGTLRQRRAAQLAGYGDVLFTDSAGLISEGCTWNIGFHDGDGVIWPDAPCLIGVTMRLLHDTGHRSAPVPLTRIGSMRAAFATNAAIGVRAITRIDDVAFPEQDPVLDELRAAYAAIEPEPL
jgi:branched-subunit amino acid aminotransferase/4-amino-4-deoxychorismate lyase